jgi:hypothetical protein
VLLDCRNDLIIHDRRFENSVLPDCRVDIFPSWWLDFPDDKVENLVLPNCKVDMIILDHEVLCLLITGLTWRLFLMTRLIFLVLPDCRVNLIFSNRKVLKTQCFQSTGLTWRLFLMIGLIFLFLLDFPNGKVYLIFFSFQGQNYYSSLLSTQWFFLCLLRFITILLDSIEDFFCNNSKIFVQCFEVRLHACVLT